MDGLGSVTAGAAESLLQQLVPGVLPRLAAWAEQTVRALPAAESSLPGYRDLEVRPDQQGFVWKYPRSNSAERIQGLLWLNKKLGDDRYRQSALRYAHTLIDDPLRGIYQGDEEDGRGQVWYWRDVGVYVTNYTIRVPAAMLALSEVTGDENYLKIAELSGRQLAHSQRPETGIPREGWWPRSPPKSIDVDPEIRKIYVSPFKINSRVGFAALPFAQLYVKTERTIYRDALLQLLAGLEHYQRPDGAFPADIRIDRFEVLDPLMKGHYMTYILNGLARASALMPAEAGLLRIAERLGEFLVSRFREANMLPYGDLSSDYEPERYVWHSSNPDAVYGFAWLSKRTGNPMYREIACRIALNTLLNVLDYPDEPDLHGGVPIWPSQHLGRLPEFNSHHHFWTILGLQALEETAEAGAARS
jgi:hypothetical protein